jgi:hypothetical protein
MQIFLVCIALEYVRYPEDGQSCFLSNLGHTSYVRATSFFLSISPLSSANIGEMVDRNIRDRAPVGPRSLPARGIVPQPATLPRALNTEGVTDNTTF